MKEYRVGVWYNVYGYVTVQAENEEQAYHKALNCNRAEAQDTEYIYGSWHVDESDITEINYEERERAALKFWTHIRDEARREWKSWVNDYPEGQSGSKKHIRRERFLQWLCAKYHGEWNPVYSVVTFRSKQGVCEVYVSNLWVEKECDPEVRMSTTLWHHRPDGVYENEKFVPPMVQNELTIETEKEVKYGCF